MNTRHKLILFIRRREIAFCSRRRRCCFARFFFAIVLSSVFLALLDRRKGLVAHAEQLVRALEVTRLEQPLQPLAVQTIARRQSPRQRVRRFTSSGRRIERSISAARLR